MILLADNIRHAMRHDWSLTRRAYGWVLTPPQDINTPQPLGQPVSDAVVEYMAWYNMVTIDGDTARLVAPTT
jgi:hypothetical protein